jgi:prepilin-type N-terminal cleavage/methylation domain-containing protein
MPASRAGLTLVEVMIAVAVMVVGLSAVFDSLVTSHRVTDRGKNQALAYQEIQAQIEQLQMLSFKSLRQTFKGIAFQVSGLRPQTGTTTLGTVTNLLASRTPYSGQANPNVFLATDTKMPLLFKVTWEDAEGVSSVQVVYVLAYRGI